MEYILLAGLGLMFVLATVGVGLTWASAILETERHKLERLSLVAVGASFLVIQIYVSVLFWQQLRGMI